MPLNLATPVGSRPFFLSSPRFLLAIAAAIVVAGCPYWVRFDERHVIGVEVSERRESFCFYPKEFLPVIHNFGFGKDLE